MTQVNLSTFTLVRYLQSYTFAKQDYEVLIYTRKSGNLEEDAPSNWAYAGLPYKRGSDLGCIFGGPSRAVLPAVKSIGAKAARRALQLGADVAGDYLRGENIKTALKRRGKEALAGTLDDRSKYIQTETGLGVRPRKRNLKRLRRKPDIFQNASRSSKPGFKSELDLFSVFPTQVNVERCYWAEISTKYPVTDTGPYLFELSRDRYMVDLNRNYLQLWVRTVDADGAGVALGVNNITQVAPVSLSGKPLS